MFNYYVYDLTFDGTSITVNPSSTSGYLQSDDLIIQWIFNENSVNSLKDKYWMIAFFAANSDDRLPPSLFRRYNSSQSKISVSGLSMEDIFGFRFQIRIYDSNQKPDAEPISSQKITVEMEAPQQIINRGAIDVYYSTADGKLFIDPPRNSTYCLLSEEPVMWHFCLPKNLFGENIPWSPFVRFKNNPDEQLFTDKYGPFNDVTILDGDEKDGMVSRYVIYSGRNGNKGRFPYNIYAMSLKPDNYITVDGDDPVVDNDGEPIDP
jgi:hypothetical protein